MPLLPRMKTQAQEMPRSLLGVRRPAPPCDSTASISMVPAAAVAQETPKTFDRWRPIRLSLSLSDSDHGEFRGHGTILQEADFRETESSEVRRQGIDEILCFGRALQTIVRSHIYFEEEKNWCKRSQRENGPALAWANRERALSSTAVRSWYLSSTQCSSYPRIFSSALVANEMTGCWQLQLESETRRPRPVRSITRWSLASNSRFVYSSSASAGTVRCELIAKCC
jgi:hypothetical protein